MEDKIPLGDLLKHLEQAEAGRRAPKGRPLMARLDGRSFHTWTRGLPRPYSESLSELMVNTTKHLIEETNPLIGYTQSDEISLCWYVDENSESDYLFDGKFQKLTSVLASIATAFFNRHAHGATGKTELATFDCRVWSVETFRTAYLNFLWREQDAIKNAISMAAQAHFSHNALQKKNSAQKIMMLAAAGIDFSSYPEFFRRGTYCRRTTISTELTPQQLAKIPEKHRPTGPVDRSFVKTLKIPLLATMTNAEQVLFFNAEPQLKQSPGESVS